VQAQPQPQLQLQPQRAQPAAFDPFGNDLFAIVPLSNQPANPRPSNVFSDPFATAPAPALVQPNNSNYNNPFSSQQQQSYEEKAQHIKAAFAPTLQPTASNPFASPTNAVSSPNSYPKPNYNVNVGPPAAPQPMTMVPYGVQYPNAPANGMAYGIPPQQMPRQPPTQQYGAPRNNNLF